MRSMVEGPPGGQGRDKGRSPAASVTGAAALNERSGTEPVLRSRNRTVDRGADGWHRREAPT